MNVPADTAAALAGVWRSHGFRPFQLLRLA